jgi:propanediol dehydratase medium subunit
VRSAVNDPNDYTGPGTGYSLTGERWDRLQNLPHQTAAIPQELKSRRRAPIPTVIGAAAEGSDTGEVVIGVGPAFLGAITETIGGLAHEDVLGAIVAGLNERGARWRTVRVRRTSDVAFIAHDAAGLAGSRIGIGIQSKGTTVIHRADLQPLDNLELFGMAPLLTLDSYRAIGRNAAAYAFGSRPSPVPVEVDNYARAKLIVQTTLLHALETQEVEPRAPALEFRVAQPS